MSPVPDAWLAQAADDYRTAQILKNNGKHNWACYLAAQAAEKAVKALLLAAGRNPGNTHSLNALLHALLPAGIADTVLLPLRPGARFLTRAEIGSRYPLDIDLPKDLYGEEESTEALAHAQDFLTLAVNHLQSSSLDDYLAGISSSTMPDNPAG